MEFAQKSTADLEADIMVLWGLISKPDATPHEIGLHEQHIAQIQAEITRRKTPPPAPAIANPSGHKTIPNWIVIAALFIVGGLFYNVVNWLTYKPPTPEEQHQTDIQNVFTGSGGSVPSVVEYIKANMNDPASFEHVKTTYREEDGHLFVVMTYRGKNGFNATVMNMIGARVGMDGKIIEVVNQ